MNRSILIFGWAFTAYNAYALTTTGAWLVALLAVFYSAAYTFEARMARGNPELARHHVITVVTSQLLFLLCALAQS